VSESGEYIEFEAPCCYSVRTCYDTEHLIISLKTMRALRRIEAVRCYRGYTKKYKFYPSDNVILVYHYVSNRNVHYIRVLWKPENLDESKAIEVVRKALGLEVTSKIIVLGEEVKEVVE
jgi:hypothetical protein